MTPGVVWAKHNDRSLCIIEHRPQGTVYRWAVLQHGATVFVSETVDQALNEIKLFDMPLLTLEELDELPAVPPFNPMTHFKCCGKVISLDDLCAVCGKIGPNFPF